MICSASKAGHPGDRAGQRGLRHALDAAFEHSRRLSLQTRLEGHALVATETRPPAVFEPIDKQVLALPRRIEVRRGLVFLEEARLLQHRGHRGGGLVICDLSGQLIGGQHAEMLVSAPPHVEKAVSVGLAMPR